MMRKCSMFMGKKKEPLRGKGLFAESVPDLRVRRHLIRAEGAAPRSEAAFLAARTAWCMLGRKGTVGCGPVSTVDRAGILARPMPAPNGRVVSWIASWP